jgi:hypothetical protein
VRRTRGHKGLDPEIQVGDGGGGGDEQAQAEQDRSTIQVQRTRGEESGERCGKQ